MQSKETAAKKALRQMGAWMFARYCRNLGIPFEDCYQMMFNRLPKDFGKAL